MERENNEVEVRSYDRKGTRVKEHRRRKPTLFKAKLKMTANEDGGRIKGTFIEKDAEGRVIGKERINEPFKFNEEQKRELQRIGGS